MSAEEQITEEVVIPIDPLIHLLHLRFAFTSQHTSVQEKKTAKDAILQEVKDNDMRPYQTMLFEMFGWTFDEHASKQMDERNAKRIDEFDAKVKDAVDNLGDTEVRDALLAKCNFYARIGDFQNCLKVNEECATKTLAAGPKLDLCFQRIRLGLAFADNDVAAKGIQDAHRLMKDGDWERRNRLKVYEGLYHISIRNFEKGGALLIDSLSTFASTELLDFKQYIFITVVSGLITLSRADLKKKIVDSPEVVSAGIKELNELVESIYQCRYGQVFAALDKVCQMVRSSVFLSLHTNYFFREVRVLVFNQFLDSYSSVTLKSMALSFSIPVHVLDAMLCTLISNERVACKIDRVSGNVTTYRGDQTNFQYHKIVKNGDILLNRIQKLTRLVEM